MKKPVLVGQVAYLQPIAKSACFDHPATVIFEDGCAFSSAAKLCNAWPVPPVFPHAKPPGLRPFFNRLAAIRVRARHLVAAVAAAAIVCSLSAAPPPDSLEAGFRNPPSQARLRCYWWWLNGHTDEQTITADLEAMARQGYGGALLVDANGSSQNGNQAVPPGPEFGTAAWQRLYVHALREAARLHLEISLNITSGWNLGGPNVSPEESAKVVTWSRLDAHGPATLIATLDQPKSFRDFYRDIAVLAYPLHHSAAMPGDAANGDRRNPIRLLNLKAVFKEAGFSMPDSKPLLEDFPAVPEEQDTNENQVLDLSAKVSSDGRLQWQVPAGEWEILRIGYTGSGAKVSTSSGAWQGLAIDYLDHTALDSYWSRNVQPLLGAAKPYLNRSLRYLVTDSWELGGVNWTPAFRAEFQRRRGYDPIRFLPVLAGRIVESRDASNRFLNDFRRTIADLIVAEHYRHFANLSQRYGLGIHPESGGPHGAPIDALETLGVSTFPQTEYWAPSKEHRTQDKDRFFIKEASSAAHIYGKTLVAAEGMTSIGPQWEESPGRDLKPAFDQALCAGMNRLVWHTFTSSPKDTGFPGQEYFAGTHLNPKVTWFHEASALTSYINRSSFLMQQGVSVADVLYYYGDWAPNFVQLKASDPAHVLPGYDYDVTDEDVLVHKLTVNGGNLVAPGGTRYRMLVLPDVPNISPAALTAIGSLIRSGATVYGHKPSRTTGLTKGLVDDSAIRKLADGIWGDCDGVQHTERRYGRGTITCGGGERQALARHNILPDFDDAGTHLDYVHRRAGNTDIYFVRNASARDVRVNALFRVSGRAPELWRAEDGSHEALSPYREEPGRTAIPLSLYANESLFVVFRAPSQPRIATLEPKVSEAAQQITGPWTVSFTPGWGAPAQSVFPELISWPASSDPGIRYYSGTAVYTKQIEIDNSSLGPGKEVLLDLGDVRELARVSVNGQDLGVLWHAPFVVNMSHAAHLGVNTLRISVTNLWPNRIIGDRTLPPDRRFTHTNIQKFKADSPLLPSGLLGPVLIRGAHRR